MDGGCVELNSPHPRLRTASLVLTISQSPVLIHRTGLITIEVGVEVMLPLVQVSQVLDVGRTHPAAVAEEASCPFLLPWEISLG